MISYSVITTESKPVTEHAECNKSTICRWEKEQIKIYPDLYSKVMDFYKNYRK